jgi:glycosyltransferase involved in cell wall biosynthesis
MLGTIEPRKNLSFILDGWEVLSATMQASKMPNLIVIGKRGWEDSDTLKRLDQAANVSELSDLSDQEVQAHFSACTALLFPSHVEGYGLPAQEALALGLPVIASDIPVFRELFADTATLLPNDNTQVWVDFIQNVLLNPDNCRPMVNYFNKTKTWNDFFVEIYTNLNGEPLS